VLSLVVSMKIVVEDCSRFGLGWQITKVCAKRKSLRANVHLSPMQDIRSLRLDSLVGT